MSEERCSIPRCREEPAIKDEGRWLCDKHWEKECDTRMKKETKRNQSTLTLNQAD